MHGSLQLLELTLQVLTLYYGGCLMLKNQLTGGEVVALLLYQISLTAAIDVRESMPQNENIQAVIHYQLLSTIPTLSQ